MTTPCVLTLEGVDIPVWEAEFTQVVINAGGGGGGGGGPAAWGAIIGTLANQTDLALALAGKLSAASNLGDLPNTATARANLGLGSAAQSAASSFATAAQGGKADTALQPGAGLSAIDSAAASKLAGVQAGAQVNAVVSVAGKTGAVTLAAGDIAGLGALAIKSAVAVADVSASGTPGASTFLRGDGTWAVPPAGGGGGSSAWGAISGTLSDQTDLQTALNAKANTSDLAAVATAGTYASLTGKPTLGTAAAANTGDFATAAQGTKADTAVQPATMSSALAGKVDAIAGKGLSTEDYTSAEKTKLAGIAAGATANATDAQLRDRSTHTGTQLANTISDLTTTVQGITASQLVAGANVTITPSGGTLTIAASGGGGGASACVIPLDGWFGMVYPARPGQSGSSSYSTIGVGSAVVGDAGTLSTPSIGSSSLLASKHRLSLTSAAAANSGVDFFLSRLSLMRGAAPGHGGFVIKTAFAVTSSVATQRFWIATHTYGGNLTPTQAFLTSGNVLGIGFDSALHSNYQLMHGNGGALTYVGLGPNFPINDPSAIIDVDFRCPPNGSAITYTVRDLNSGLSTSGTLTSNLPNGSTVMLLRSFMSNGGTAAAVSYDLMPVYYSSYWSA